MDAKEIFNKYGESQISRMVSGGGTLKQRLADRKLLDDDYELRELVFQLQKQLSTQKEEIYLESFLEEEKKQQSILEKELTEEIWDMQIVNDADYEKWVIPPAEIVSPNPIRIFFVNTGKFIRRNAAVIFIVSGLLGGSRYYVERNILNNGNSVADNTPEREVTGNQGGTNVENAAETDTLCNCGKAQLRTAFESVSDNNYGAFKKELNSQLDTGNLYVNQCNAYWTAWALYNEQNYNEAIRVFETLQKGLPTGELRQRAEMGLMNALWKADQQERETFIGFLKFMWKTEKRERLRELAKTVTKEPQYYKRAQDVAKRYIEILD